ncbi:hypothetical protein ACE7GA_03030 [Roseomonas sp. CCTCC AB2023176]|uniref:hypothetical protein n=1 Tax=Roseomonas sp. CCTCC AB2023176 TaxID=3342640 RepID=UPI0035E078E8
MRQIMKGYVDFLAGAPVQTEDPKAFAAHHAAGRACLNHVQQLRDMMAGGDASQAEFDETLRRAQDAMNADIREDSDDGGDDT